MTAFDLIALGDNCIDRLTGAVTADLVGGNAVNVAVQAAMLGLSTAYCGAVGPTGEADADRVLTHTFDLLGSGVSAPLNVMPDGAMAPLNLPPRAAYLFEVR